MAQLVWCERTTAKSVRRAVRTMAAAIVFSLAISGCAVPPPAVVDTPPIMIPLPSPNQDATRTTTSPLLSPATSATAAPTPATDLTLPGAASAMVGRLLAAAGTTHAVSVTLSQTEASLSVLIGQTTTTYAYRDGVVKQVDSDVTYVGQAIFDPRDFAIDDLGALFRRAAAVSGSTRGQQLQIVDYDLGGVYMSVTTNPESVPVFFLPDAQMVQPVDLTSADGLRSALADAVGGNTAVARIGLSFTTSSAASVSTDVAGAPGEVIRTTRQGSLPPRTMTRPDAAVPPPFDPALVDVDALLRFIGQMPESTGQPPDKGFTIVIEQRPGEQAPRLHATTGSASVTALLDGTIVTG